LETAGYRVLGADTPRAAAIRLAAPNAPTPAVVLTPIDADHPSGTPLLDFLRARASEPPMVVVLTNGDPAGRRHALRLGLSHLVQPPFDDEEVVLSTQLALDQRRDERRLSGSLAQMSPVDLLQTAEAGRRSGRIVLRHRGHHAEVTLRDGRVIDAEVDDGRRAEEAVYEIACWDDGSFEASFGPVEGVERITASTTSLLLEAMRRRDEAARDANREVETPPNAALEDPPPPPPRRLLALHRALTLLNTASSYANEHVVPTMLASRLEEIRHRLAGEWPPLDAFAVNERGQVVLTEDSDDHLQGFTAEQLVEAVAVWLAELFRQLERALPGRFPLTRLRAISESIQQDLSNLGFYRGLGLDPEPHEETT
ncbi:MAG TPA: DUF4388 domain-containing protein, partial [Thermoanaerobaculia bacterium]|nr:DUF4388 domain-containing protein [Thermoanaerobaculia bacterium]